MMDTEVNNSLSVANQLISITLTDRQVCDFELIVNQGFHPLRGFMSRHDYDSVLENMRLADGTLWPMPITLDVDDHMVAALNIGMSISLRDAEGLLLGIMCISDIWEVNKKQEAQAVFGTLDDAHPGVSYLYHQTKDFYVGGRILHAVLPHHYDFNHLRKSPAELKKHFNDQGLEKIVAFQTRNPMHRAHQELTLRAAEQTKAHVLIHPVVGMTKPGDIEYYLRVRCYEHVLKKYPNNTASLSLLPLAMRMAGPKEALWHAIIRKNYGCTHFIVGRDHAGPGKDKMGNLFYDPYAAQQLALKHQDEIDINIVPFQEMVYSKQQKRYFAINEFPEGETPTSISGTELREALQKNLDIPEWFSYPDVIQELRAAYPSKLQQGFTILFTGLPSAGKSTLANALMFKLREKTNRQITLLDGDVVRAHLSKGLGFSQEDRETNITRTGFVAAEVTKHQGIAICALVAPFAKARNLVRSMVERVGGFIEIYVSTDLSTCEARDRKGLYKQARQGIVKQFTGISDPYEVPAAPEIVVDTACLSPQQAVDFLLREIAKLGYVSDSSAE